MEKNVMSMENCQKNWGQGFWSSLKTSFKTQVRDQTVFCKYEDSNVINMANFFNGKRIWKVLKGEVHLVMRGEEGKTIVLLKITSENSGFVMPTTYIDSSIYSIESVCVGSTELCYIPEMLSRQIYEECTCVRQWQAQNYMQIFTKLLELINDLTFLSMKERLKKKLHEYCALYHTNTIQVTHEKLADELATSREVVSRLLKKMEVENTIKIKRRSICVMDWPENDEVQNMARMAG